MNDLDMQRDKKLLRMKNLEVIETHDFDTPEELYARLIEKVKSYHPSDDIRMIEKAYQIAYKAHEGQMRKSGEPYIIHPLCVALILSDLELDKESIVGGLLHDVVEDTVMSEEDITREFNSEVALIVAGVTKLGQLSYSSDKIEIQAENLRKMFLAMAKDIRVILIKLADRLHNMRTLKFMKPEKQREKARETMDIYAPIAQRLGISKIKVELDDLSLKYLEPEVYKELSEQIDVKLRERETFIDDMVEKVTVCMLENSIHCQVNGRVKHLFSIYKKMVNQKKTLDEVYDLFAVRIIVDTVRDCYAALGLIHEMYKPVPGRFKDYIAMPKQNMYQSLHTTLIGPNGQPFEIQIRTFDMHRTAEYGIAAHWKYKEDPNAKNIEDSEEAKLTWLRQILEWQTDNTDNKEFMSLLKDDLNLFADSVYCFTPAGDVKSLPTGSTPIDFAYSIHSAVGNKMVGARVNGKLVNIDYVIRNGDRVEVITSANSKGPSRDWLKIVRSSQARTKINQWFKTEFKEENITRGKELLNKFCKSKGIVLPDLLKPEFTEKVMRKYGFRDWDAVCAAIGHGGLKEGQVVNRLVEEQRKKLEKEKTDAQVIREIQSAGTESQKAKTGQEDRHAKKSKSGIIVKGIDDVAVRFGKCCNPVPGDEIIGYITRGRGVTIHRTDCVNMMHLTELERVRLIDAEWQDDTETSGRGLYEAELNIYVDNAVGVLIQVSQVFSERNINVTAISSRCGKNNRATINVSFDVSGKGELDQIINRLMALNCVYDISRMSG